MARLIIKNIFILVVIATFQIVSAQSEVDKIFVDTRIVNGQSVETINEGVMKFIIAHRFGRVNSGSYELWGLDNSTIRLGLDYGIFNWLNIGVGRSSFEKTYDALIKIKFLQQQNGTRKVPLSLSGYSNMSLRSLNFSDPERENYFTSRLYFAHQLLIARKFTDDFKLQLMPTVVHRNLVSYTTEENDVLAIGIAPSYRISKKIILNAEYYYVLPDQLADPYFNSLAIGIDLETKGHVFQFHFGNSRGMTEKFFVSETTGDWAEGDIHFGFNITRDFKVKGRKYRAYKE